MLSAQLKTIVGSLPCPMKGASLQTWVMVGSSFIGDGSDVLKGPEFAHAQPDSKDKAEQLTSLATEPGLSRHVQLTLTVTHVLEQKRGHSETQQCFGVGWLEAFWSWASAVPVRR